MPPFLARVPPLTLVAAALLLGDAVAAAVPMPYGAVAIAGFAACAALLWVVAPAHRPCTVAVAAAFHAALAADQVYRPVFPGDHIAQYIRRDPVELQGSIAGDVMRRGTRGNLVLQVDQVREHGALHAAHGRVRIALRRLRRAWQPGDRVRLRTALRRPNNFGTPGEFDYVAHLARQRVYVTGFVDDDATIERLGGAAAGTLTAWRDRIGTLIQRNVGQPAAGVLRALIIGREDAISPQLRAAFSRVGVSHVLSISGLHVGLVASAGFAITRWLLARSAWLLLALNVPKCAVGISVLPVLLYAGIAGSNVATLRSVLMILVFLGAVVVDRQRHLQVSLAAAAIVIVAASPGAALDISFQLSFVAVWALALVTQRFWQWWPRFAERRLLRLRKDWRARLWRPLLLYGAVSSGALLATTPLTAYHFNQVTPIAPLANAVVVPLLGSAAVMIGLAGAFCEPLSSAAAGLLFSVAGGFARLGVALVEALARVPGACVRVPTPTLFELGLAYALLSCILCGRGRALWWGGLVLAVLCATDLGWRCRERWHADLRVTFLSVGQGDAAVVELPSGKVLVIDGGGIGDGSFDVGERIVAPFLWQRAILSVYAVSFSHPQFDHYGGLPFIVAEFAPREVWSSGQTADAAHFTQLLQACKDAAAQPLSLRRGDEWVDGPTRVRVLGPPPGRRDRNPNQDSLVLQVQFAGTSILFTGDIEAAAEQELVAADSAALPAAVLKVPHHGSHTSSTAPFVRAVSPRLAVISAGRDNRFHFPHPEIVQRYSRIRAAVLRTDRDGAIEVRVGADGTLAVACHTAGARPDVR